MSYLGDARVLKAAGDSLVAGVSVGATENSTLGASWPTAELAAVGAPAAERDDEEKGYALVRTPGGQVTGAGKLADLEKPGKGIGVVDPSVGAGGRGTKCAAGGYLGGVAQAAGVPVGATKNSTVGGWPTVSSKLPAPARGCGQ